MTSYSWPFRTDSQAYLQARMTLLASRLEEVNAMALAGDLPDVDISDKGVKITHWRTAFLQVFRPFADLVYGMLPHPKITEILEEVDSWTDLRVTSRTSKIITSDQKTEDCCLITILADGINLGLNKNGGILPWGHKIVTRRYSGMVHQG